MSTKLYFSFYLGVSLITPQCPVEYACSWGMDLQYNQTNRSRVGEFLSTLKNVCFLKVQRAEVKKNKPE